MKGENFDLKFLFSRRALILYAGLAFGILSALLVNWGNPQNMGFCSLCFLRDIAGALRLHSAGAAINATVTPNVISASTTAYLRPEIIGLVIGALAAGLLFREFRPRGGASPLVRFILGVLIAVGALIFLGCPWRMILRLGGGDLTALIGLAGLMTGVSAGIYFLRNGFNLGRATRTFAVAGWITPVIFIALLVVAIIAPTVIARSTGGPGALHPAIWISLAVGLFIGFLAQRTRFCTMGGWRDLILAKDTYLFLGLLGLFIGVLATNYIVGNFAKGGLLGTDIIYHWGFTKQPIALPGVDTTGAARYVDYLWDFGGLALVGLAAVLAGGCPLRQLVMSGEGDTDAGMTVFGMIVGAGLTMSLGIASSATSAGKYGPWALAVGLIVCIVLGFTMREKA
jgi:YedE family putative selenium metabolism protein